MPNITTNCAITYTNFPLYRHCLCLPWWCMKVYKLSVINFIIVWSNFIPNKHPIQGGNLIAMLFGLLYLANCEKLSYSYESLLHGLSTPSLACY